jgi:hypothetical protein
MRSIKAAEKSEQRMKDASGSEQHKTEAMPYDSFDLLHNFFIVEVGEQQVSFAVATKKKLVDFEPRFEKLIFFLSRGCFVHTQFQFHSLGWITIFHFSASQQT